ncbi:hypothetical protein [Alteromonas phage JH01]|nr:hypothetical protein [Alteromonas phage JH01]
MPFLISGTITNNGNPVSVPVVAFSTTVPSILLGSTVSAADGKYTISELEYKGSAIVVAYSNGGTLFNPTTVVLTDDIISPVPANGYVYRALNPGTLGNVEPEWATDNNVISGDVTLEPIQVFAPSAAGYENTLFYMPDSVQYKGRNLVRGTSAVVGGKTYYAYSDTNDPTYIGYFDELIRPLSITQLNVVNADFETGDLSNWQTTKGTPDVREIARGDDVRNVVYGAATLEWGVSQQISLPILLSQIGYPTDAIPFLFDNVTITLKVAQSSYNNSDPAQQYIRLIDSNNSEISFESNDLKTESSLEWVERTVSISANSNMDLNAIEVELYGYRTNGSNNDGYTTSVRVEVVANE